MDFSRIILGSVVTEKAERQKGSDARAYTLWVDKSATKISVKAALEHLYDIDVARLRVMRTRSKTRTFGAAQTMVKRAAMKKMIVTLTPKSKPLDLASFKHA